MKYGKLLALSAVLVALGAGYSAIAQTQSDSTNPPAAQTREGGWRRHGGDRPKLNLTDDQKTKLKSLHEGVRQQAQAIRNDASLSADEKQAKIKALHENTRQQFQAVLTPEQQQQVQNMRGKGRGGRGFGREFGHGGPRMELGLTADQRSQLESIHKSTREQMSAIRSDTTLTADQKEAKLKSLFQSSHQQANNILTPEQQQKLKEGHRRGGHFGGPRGHRGMGGSEETQPVKP